MSVMFPEPYRPGEREIRLSEVCASTAAAVVERQRSRAAAKENEKRFTVTMESSLVPFCILTPVHDESRRIIDFRWTYLNPAAARALGREIPQLLGRRIGAVLPGVWDAPEMFAHYVKVVETGVPSEFEVCSVATGRGGWFNVVASPLQGSAAVWFADISERKRQQQTLEEADRRKDEFLATLAHELRNPLAPMRQAVRIAGAANSTESQKLWAHAVIERQVQHMSLLLDDLLDVSRITRGTLLLRKAAVSLTTIIDNAVEIARPALEARRHRLRLMLPQARVTLQVDPLRLSQVLGNLLINAAKYTDPEGDIRLGVELEDAALVVRVTDNGIGLSGEQLQQLFVMFSQLASGAARSQGGLGIGLALSRGLIELHGGELVASSAGPGQGSEFTVRLPSTCYSRSAAATADPAARQRPDGAGAAHRILIADDNPDAADSLAELLRLEGHTVEVAYDGAQALASFASFEPAAALLDVGMPRMSGLEVVRAIRQLPAGRDAVLIAITGWGQEIDRRNAIDAGFDHHVTKPMDPVYVQDLIARGRARVRAT
jgi:signal transduction histidine kinase/ActR/RegA family two-component response regulator